MVGVTKVILLVFLGLGLNGFNPFSQPQSSCQPNDLPLPQVQNYAEAITVKVFAEDISGSGILLQKTANTYLVITNEHVIAYSNSEDLEIETPDGKVYTAKLATISQLDNKDLALFTFESKLDYQVADIWQKTPVQVNQTVFVAGFPIEADKNQSRGFRVTPGQIMMIIAKELTGGYQLGYTNDVQKGMSGGPIFNCQGELVGINGLHKNPIWDYPYVFADGTIPTETEQTQMRSLSWGISGHILEQLIPINNQNERK